jgi:hypothetical protein
MPVLVQARPKRDPAGAFCPAAGCFESPFTTTDADGYAPNNLDNLPPSEPAGSLRPMAQRSGEIEERDAEVTFRFPVHPMAERERQALDEAVRGSGYRFVRVEDTLVRNLGAGGGWAGPYVIIDFVVPVIQHAGGDLLAIAALAGLKKALAALRRSHPQRILHVRVGRRRPVTYRLTGDVDLDAALDAIPSDYQRLPRGAKDREWVGGRWIELAGSRWQAVGDAPDGVLLPAARAVANVLRYLFICSWFEGRLRSRPTQTLRLVLVDGEMLGWLAVFLLTWIFQPWVGWANVVVLFLAALRMLNILGYSLYSVLNPATTEGMTAFASIRRTVLMNLVNLLTVWAVFALAYRNVIAATSTGFPHARVADSLNQSAYLSWSTLLTLGSDYQPASAGAQALVAIELGLGLVILAVTLAAVLGSLRMESRLP